MARSLDQIIAELGTTYDPQIANVRQQQAAIPTTLAADEQGLQAKQDSAFNDILSGARNRGLGFSGIPLGEQAKYTATNYLPALANMRTSARQQQMGLEDTILGINERRRTMAQQLHDAEINHEFQQQQFAEQQRQFNENLALQHQQAARAPGGLDGLAPLLAPLLSGNPMQSSGNHATMIQRSDKGFSFTDANGNAISAAQYAQGTGQSFRDLLTKMASAGDQGAKTALGFVGNDFGYDPIKVGTNQAYVGLYNALVGGTGRQASAYNVNPGQSAATSNILKPTLSINRNRLY